MDTKQKLFTLRTAGKKYEIIPLIAFVSMVVVGGTAFSVYAAYQKPDVKFSGKRDEPPWEAVDPEKVQKLVTFDQKYKKIPELEKLRQEIGSYKH